LESAFILIVVAGLETYSIITMKCCAVMFSGSLLESGHLL